MNRRLHHGLGQQHGPWTWTPTWSPVSSSSADRGGLFQRVPIQKMNHSASRTSCHCPEPGQSCAWAAHSGVQSCYTTLSALLSNGMFPGPPLLCSHTCHHSVSSSASLQTMPTVQSPFPHLHGIFNHQSDTADCSMLHNIVFYPNIFTCKYLLQQVIGLVQGFSFRSTINTGL